MAHELWRLPWLGKAGQGLGLLLLLLLRGALVTFGVSSKYESYFGSILSDFGLILLYPISARFYQISA